MNSVQELTVFIGSPGDVSAERERALEVIERINKDVFAPDGIRLRAIAWDANDYARPHRLAPQAAINQGLATPSQCDIAIFMFWKRIGTPLAPATFDENGAGPEATGTLWEFHDAIGAHSHTEVFVFRDMRPIQMSPDEMREPSAFAAQVERVNDLFASFKDSQRRYVKDHIGYGSADDFANQLEVNLKATVKRVAAERSGEQPLPPASNNDTNVGSAVPPDYRKKLATAMARMEMLGLDVKENITNGLPEVYVPALTQAEKADDAEDAEERLGDHHTLLLDRLGKQSLYVPGNPGSGKSTFCEWTAFVIATGELPAHAIPAPDRFREALPDDLRDRLPVLIRLREFWRTMACPGAGAEWGRADLECGLVAWLNKQPLFDLSGDALRQELEAGRLLLMLDGVDEVPEEHGQGDARTEPRHCLLTGLADALETWQSAGNRVLITSRPYGLSARQVTAMGIPQAPILALPRPLQHLFVERWFAAAVNYDERGDYVDGLWKEIAPRDELRALQENPLLLTAICVKYKEGKRLPQDIYALYDAVVNQVLFARFRGSDKERSRVRWRLEAVALGMHYGDDENPRESPLASVNVDELDRILGVYAERNPTTERGADEVLARRETLLEGSGLLLPRGQNEAEFYHQDFRDYLAAERWDRERRRLADALQSRAADRNWHRMLEFLFAKTIETSGGVDAPLGELECMAERLTPKALAQDWQSALLVARCLEIANGRVVGDALATGWADRWRALCEASVAIVADVKDRNALWLALGRLGWDTRTGVGVVKVAGAEKPVPDIAWLPVPNAEAPAYFIAKYPVTNAQFQAFVDAPDGY
ncbi:MAG: hypothetical protein AAF493_18890, partial [Pseudomonadota bacterium]